MCTGFRLLTEARWNVESSDPTIWVKVCDTGWSFNQFSFPQGDPLWGTGPTVPKAIESVYEDINKISTSFVRLASYPEDPYNPPAPQTGDSAFTFNRSEYRIIKVCFSGGGPFSGGHARPRISDDGKHLYSCEIIIEDSNRYNSAAFIATLGHELGHCLGLDHAHETTHSIMSYFSNELNFMRYRIDDKMALTYLYPAPNADEDLKESPSYGLGCNFKK